MRWYSVESFRYQLAQAAGVIMAAVLRAAGTELDGRDMPLEEAGSACESFSFASVLCCVPSELAFFFGDVAAPRNRLLLRRSGGAR